VRIRSYYLLTLIIKNYCITNTLRLQVDSFLYQYYNVFDATTGKLVEKMYLTREAKGCIMRVEIGINNTDRKRDKSDG